MIPSGQTPGRLAENVMHFARVLRSAGLPVGTDRVQLALQALPVAGLEGKADFHAVLSACFVSRHEQQTLFDQAFTLYWRDPDLAGRMRALLLPRVNTNTPPPVKENRRLGDALFPSTRRRAGQGAAAARDRARSHAHLERAGAAAEGRLRNDEHG